MKRLVICCDGSFQNLECYPTNVVKIAQATQHVDEAGVPQIIYYDEGVGSNKFINGIFGWGLEKNIQEAYQFLCMNYAPDDQIYLFGFSRGAYTVRSLGGLLYHVGLLPRRHLQQTAKAYQLYRVAKKNPADIPPFRENYNSTPVKIKLLACWDTVGGLGVPDVIPWLPFDRWANRKYRFHDTTLSPLIENAIHAISIDEPNRNFDVTLMEQSPDHPPEQRLRQVWFPGDHMSVGGGSYHRRRLSDLSLLWMIEQIQAWNLGLAFNLDQIAGGVDPDFTSDIPNNIPSIFKVGGKISRKVTGNFANLHPSVKQRWHKRPDYRPANLAQFRSELEQGQALSNEN